jgi:hypothetical protein
LKGLHSLFHEFLSAWRINRIPITIEPSNLISVPFVSGEPKVAVGSKIPGHLTDFAVVSGIHDIEESFLHIEFSCVILVSD